MKKNRQILVLAALLFSFLCFPADKVLAASNVVEVPLTVKQNFEENSNEIPQSYRYRKAKLTGDVVLDEATLTFKII